MGFALFVTMLVIFFYFIIKKLKSGDKNLYLPILIAVVFFLFYNFFDSSAFVSTNMLAFFFLLSFPMASYSFKSRKKKMNSYILISLFLPFAIALGKPLYAQQQYAKGISFFATQKYLAAKDCFVSAIGNDSLNSEYTSRLADVYFTMYQQNEAEHLLDFAIELVEEYALNFNKRGAKYYYQLAWFYRFKGNQERAVENIIKSVEMDPFNSLYLESYGSLL